MKDITNIIDAAISVDVVWGVGSFLSSIEKMERKGLKVSFWEGEENWASILMDDELIGYMWRKHPLVFVLSQYEDGVKESLNEFEYVFFIGVDSLSDKNLRINSTELKHEMDIEMFADEFSADDLWFHTNSDI